MGTATTERAPGDNQLPLPLELPPPPTGTAVEAPDPPTLELGFDDHLLTVTIKGTPNVEYEILIDGPGTEDYTEEGRLNGPQTRIDITNPTQGDWVATGTLTSHNGVVSENAASNALTTPTPVKNQPTSAELAQKPTAQADLSLTTGDNSVPYWTIAAVLTIAAIIAIAFIRYRARR